MTDSARQYALAVFGLAKESDVLDALLLDFARFLMSYDEETRMFFQHPSFRKGEKKDFISHLDLMNLLKNFLYLLIDNNRMDMIQEIYTALQDIIANQNKQLVVKIISKTPLSREQLLRVKNKLEKDYMREVQFEELIDSTMIAGYKLLFEGSVLDDTIERKLNDMRTNLKKN